MEGAECINENGQFKACPYRIFTEEHKAITIGQGDIVSQSFYPCIGENCAEFHVGKCFRGSDEVKRNRKGGN